MDRIGLKEVTLIYLGISEEEEKERARSWIEQKYPNLKVKMEDEFEGQETTVVIVIANGDIGDSPSMVRH